MTNHTTKAPVSSPSAIFESHVFNTRAQELYLPKKIIHHLQAVQSGRAHFDIHYADEIAKALHNWASKHGATHYTHWFQPLTGGTGEKHDAFFTKYTPNGLIEELKGKDLLSAEPDASSLPSGGLRTTHQARGYTTWDTLTPPFLKQTPSGLTLCIPSLFYSWKSEALDFKIPLLRSEQKLEKTALRLLSFCNQKASSVYSTLGAEQEYFLIDKDIFLHRPDLILCGRTIFGAKPAKGQELEDHYLAPIPSHIIDFIRDFEEQALRLGIPLKTRHNEVAPSQYEAAPLFEKASIASDHNLMLMDLMRTTADAHNLACLLHEKPFAPFNGSGKHNNWSLATDSGQNLLTPDLNSLPFLTLLTAIISGIHEYAPILRASIASAGNDHRLGGAEAPPTILSIFLGIPLETAITDIAQGKTPAQILKRPIELNLRHLNPEPVDSADRNRTSFFAFTGNKFEFRAVGSSANCAWPITVINAIVADRLTTILDELESAIKDHKTLTDEQRLHRALPILQKHLLPSLAILFSGNGYSKEWTDEANARDLPNIAKSFHTFEHLHSKKAQRLFDDILSVHELESRVEIFYERYAKQMNIETNLAIELFHTLILPAVQKDLHTKATTIQKLAQAGVHSQHQTNILIHISQLLDQAIQSCIEIETYQKQTQGLGWQAKGRVFCDLLAPAMIPFRQTIDELETLTDAALWPLPKYRELLF